MKKIFLSLIFAMVAAVSVQAQSLKFGLEAGLNMSKLQTSDALANLSSNNRAGWYFGPKVKFSTIFGLGVDAALLYSQKRLDFKDESSKTFRSIEIPVNLRYNIGLASLASIYLATGPQFGFNVGNKSWGLDVNSVTQNFQKENMSTSWNIGAGVTLVKHLEVGLLYNIAISKYYKAAGSNDYNFKSNSFQIQAAYYF